MPLNSRDMKYQYDQLDVDALRQLITASKLQEQDSDSNVLLKVLLIGGNFVVSKFLCAYIALASTEASLFSDISLELFIAPVLRNDIATFLARSDKWYRRHVYYPFVGPIGICPQVNTWNYQLTCLFSVYLTIRACRITDSLISSMTPTA